MFLFRVGLRAGYATFGTVSVVARASAVTAAVKESGVHILGIRVPGVNTVANVMVTVADRWLAMSTTLAAAFAAVAQDLADEPQQLHVRTQRTFAALLQTTPMAHVWVQDPAVSPFGNDSHAVQVSGSGLAEFGDGDGALVEVVVVEQVTLALTVGPDLAHRMCADDVDAVEVVLHDGAAVVVTMHSRGNVYSHPH